MPDNPESTTAGKPAQGAPSKATMQTAEEAAFSDVIDSWVPEDESVTHPLAPSEPKQAEQEQPESQPASPAKEKPSDEKATDPELEARIREQERRKAQSEEDKRRNDEMRIRAQEQARARAELEMQAREAAERQRIENLSDSEYREEVRRKEQELAMQRAIYQDIEQRAKYQWANTMYQIAAARLTDEDKAEFARRNSPDAADQFKSYDEIVDFITEAKTKRELPKLLKEKEKAIREAIENERAAKEAEEGAAILSSGLPGPSGQNLSLEDNLLYGLAELEKATTRR